MALLIIAEYEKLRTVPAMPPLPKLTALPDGSMAFTHAGVLVTIAPNHCDRRRLRWWIAAVDGRAITVAAGTPTIAAVMAIAVLGRG